MSKVWVHAVSVYGATGVAFVAAVLSVAVVHSRPASSQQPSAPTHTTTQGATEASLVVAHDDVSIGQESGSGITVTESSVGFPALTRDAIDLFFDSLRSGSQFQPPPLQSSQNVPSNIAGMWAGVKSSVESQVGVITLRFRPTDEARLARVGAQKNLPALAESFDIELELKPAEFVIRHPLSETKRSRLGMGVDLKIDKPNPVLTEFVRGHRDAGVYFAWPPVVRQSAHNAWALLVCPRSPQLIQRRRGEEAQLELQRSPYQLRDVRFEISSVARARIPPTDKPEKISIVVLPSAGLPRAQQNSDEVGSLSPALEVPYRPASPFGFIRLPIAEQGIHEGLLIRTVTENPAGYIRRQYYSHVVYVYRLNEPSPVPVIIGDYRAARDEGECYIVSVQRSLWNQYDRDSARRGDE